MPYEKPLSEPEMAGSVPGVKRYPGVIGPQSVREIDALITGTMATASILEDES